MIKFSIFFLFALVLSSIGETAIISQEFHQQIKMEIYSRPRYSGQLQTIRTFQNKGSSPCYNLSFNRIGSFDISDPNVKLVFYRAMDCKGAPFLKDYKIENKEHVMIKSKSVSIIRLRPVSF